MSLRARYPSLEDRGVLITGGSTGIGACLVESFAAQGCKVGFLDIDVENGENLAKQLANKSKHAPVFVKADVTKITELEAGIDAIRAQIGPVSVLVNNAANDVRHTVEETTSERWDELMNVNLKHQFFCAKAVAKDMQALKGGSIINFGSVSWKLAIGKMPTYTTAKAAIHGLTRSLARIYGKENIRCNTVVPGWVFTEKQLKLWTTPEALADLDARQCLAGRMAPEDIVAIVLWLASDDAKMATSQEFTVDGGWT